MTERKAKLFIRELRELCKKHEARLEAVEINDRPSIKIGDSSDLCDLAEEEVNYVDGDDFGKGPEFWVLGVEP